MSLYVCVCVFVCVNMEMYFAVVGKIYLEGSRKEKDHGNIPRVVQHCTGSSLWVQPFKGAELVFQHVSILGKFIQVFENQSMSSTIVWDQTSSSALKIEMIVMKR